MSRQNSLKETEYDYDNNKKRAMRNAMKTILYTTTAALLLAAAGCSKGERQQTDARIAITTTIAPMSRAPQLDEEGRGNFTPGDEVSLLITDGARQASFDYAIGQSTLYWKDTPFATENVKVSISACYPRQALQDGTFRFEPETAADKDLLLAQATGVDAGSERAVALTFRHALHRLVISYTTDDPELDPDAIETRCTAHSACTVSLAENSLETDATSQDTFTAQGRRAEFLLVPQASAGVTLEIDLGAEVKRLPLVSLDGIDGELEGGKQLLVSLTVKNGQIEIGDSVIEGWGDQGSVEDEIIL